MNREPLKPVKTEEELDITFTEEDEKLFSTTTTTEYQIVVSGINEYKEENGWYWRSNLFSDQDSAMIAAAALTKSNFKGYPKNTKSFLVEVYSQFDGQDDEKIFDLEVI